MAVASVGRYQLVKPLGEGLEGKTWLGRDEKGQQAVIKYGRTNRPSAEFRILLELAHPGMPRVLDCGVQDERFWFASEPVASRSLEDGWPGDRDAEEVAAAAVQTLLYLHGCGYSHGDIHPGNILLPDRGYPVLLIDPGMEDAGPRFASGRAGFVAPEAAHGGPRGLAADIYSLGISLRRRGVDTGTSVRRFLENSMARDPSVREHAALEMAAKRPRVAGGARLRGRDAALGTLIAPLSSLPQDVSAFYVWGDSGMGKSVLLRRIAFEARARGWHVLEDVADDAGRLAIRWGAALRPTLVLLDDVDRTGDAEEVARAVERTVEAGGAGIVVVASSKVSAEGPWTSLRLTPLGPGDIGEIFREVTGVRRGPTDLARPLHESTGGNPGLAESIARSSVAAGRVVLRIGGWDLAQGADVAVPESAAAAARIEVGVLPRELASFLAHAAIARGSLPSDRLIRAAGAEPNVLDAVMARGLARLAAGAVIPRDAALGAAAAEAWPDEERTAAFGRIAQECEDARVPADVTAEFLLEAGDADRGAVFLLEAVPALRADGRKARLDALLRKALECVPTSSPHYGRLQLEHLRARAASRLEQSLTDEALEAAEASRDREVTTGLVAFAIGLLSRLREWEALESVCRDWRGRLGSWVDERLAWARAVQALAEGETEGAANLVAGREATTVSEAEMQGSVAVAGGQMKLAARRYLRAAQLARRTGELRSWGRHVESACGLLVSIGRRGAAERVAGYARRIVEARGCEHECAGIYSASAEIEFAAGNLRRSLSSYSTWTRVMTANGRLERERARMATPRALALRYLGERDEAVLSIRRAAQILPPLHRPWLAVPHALLLMDTGATDDARGVAREAAEKYRQFGDRVGLGWMKVLEAMASLVDGDGPGLATAVANLGGLAGDDPVLAMWATWIEGEQAAQCGETERAAGLLVEAMGRSGLNRPLGCEVAARAGLTLARIGRPERARALLGEDTGVPESPLLEVLRSAARGACCDKGGEAVHVLREGAPHLALAGAVARIAWYRVAVQRGKEAGEDGDLATWRRRLAAEERALSELRGVPVTREPGAGEESMDPRNSVAAQARRVQDVVREINSELDLRRLLPKILDAAIELSGAERGSIVLVEGERRVVRASRQMEGLPTEVEEFSRTISTQVLASGKYFLCGDAALDGRLEGSASVERLQIHSVLCMPFRLRGRLIGTFYLDHRTKPDVFDPAVIDTLQTLSDLAAVAIENATLFAENLHAREVVEREAQRLKDRLLEVEIRERMETEAGLKHDYPGIVGRGPAMIRMLRQVERVTPFWLPVLITGETGSGKELVAGALHAHGPQQKGPFISENCASISPLLMESELFGHVAGAFSGATSDHEGLFRRADGGVLFLDEIGDLELALQPKFLRVLEDGRVRPVGSDREYKVRVRVITATHRNLEEMVKQGKFREDLYYRLANYRVEVPALRQRIEDIPSLARRFAGRIGEFKFEAGAVRRLMCADWPGNVRQLRHAMEMIAASSTGVIREEDVVEALGLPAQLNTLSAPTLKESIDRIREDLVRKALESAGGSATRAAKSLGITYQGLKHLICKYRLIKYLRADERGPVKPASTRRRTRRPPPRSM